MQYEKKEKTIISATNDVWQNQRTGEILETTEIIKPVNRQGFMITYLTEIISLMDTLGNKKMDVVKYILKNMDKSTNTIIISTRELGEKSGVSHNTVLATLKLLDNAGITSRGTNYIMINPRLVHRGNNNKEKALLTRFHDYSNEK